MNNIFSLLSDYTFQTVAMGSALLGCISGIIGSFSLLKRQSLLGDGISHAALPGIVIAFLLSGSKNTGLLLAGAAAAGLLATFLILLITRYSRIKFDSALALIMSAFFGLGLLLLTYVQKFPNASQAGLKRFIYGQASALLKQDLVVMIFCGVILVILVLIFWKEFKIVTFDTTYARIIGLPVQKLQLLLSALMVLTIIIGLQTVGVVLMSAMMIAPAAAARQWVNRLWAMILLSALFGAISGIAGTLISSLTPGLPTGPSIVLCVSVIAFFSLLFAPNRGILFKLYRRARQKTIFSMKGVNNHVSSN